MSCDPFSFPGSLLGIPPAIILFVASLLKLNQLRILVLLDSTSRNDVIISVSLIAVEVGLAVALISKFHTEMVRRISITLFSLFLLISLLKLLSGETSCGCFGQIEIHPFFSFTFDLAAISSLLLWDTSKAGSIQLKLITSAVSVIGFIGVLIFIGSKPISLNEVGKSTSDGRLVVVETGDWIGKRFAAAKFIENGEALRNGRWQIVFYHQDCPKCQELIREAESGRLLLATAFVEIPPLSNILRKESKTLAWFTLTDSYDWFVPTPQIIEVDGGKVVRRLQELH
jgi:hypothetical protein